MQPPGLDYRDPKGIGTSFERDPTGRRINLAVMVCSLWLIANVSSAAEITQDRVPDTVRAIYGDNLAGSPAEAISVLAVVKFETTANIENPQPRFSEDGKTLLYAKSSENGGTEFIVRELLTGKVKSSYQVPGSVAKMMLSADSQKIAYLPSEFGNLHILDLAAHKDVELPVKGLDNADRIRWIKPNTIDFVKRLDANMTVRSLDLESLVVTVTTFHNNDPPTTEYDSTVFRKDLQLIQRYIPERKDHGVHLLLRSKDWLSKKNLLPYVATEDSENRVRIWSHPYLASPDLRHVVLSYDGGLSVAYLHSTPPPRMRYWIDWQAPDPFQALKPGWQKTVRSSQMPCLGKVYAGQLNPLNQKPVGADKSKYKGLVRLSDWQKGRATATVVFQLEPFTDGDVVTDMGFYDRHGQEDDLNDFQLTYYEHTHIDGWRTLTLNDPSGSSADGSDRDEAPKQVTSVQQTDAPPQRTLPTSPLPPPSVVSRTPMAATVNNNQSDGSASTSAVSTAPMVGERFPETRTRLLAAVDIANWSDAKLQYAINEMFARCGAEFGNPALNKWFARFSWYQPRPGADFDHLESSMSDVERQNLQLLGAYRTAKREALKRQPAARNQRRLSQQQKNPDYEEPNPVAQQLLESILKGVQQGLNRRR